MAIWRVQATPEMLNEHGRQTLIEHLGIEFLEIGADFIRARMPVDHTTRTPAGILHGGASASLAETLGSVAANLCMEPGKKYCVGLEINANHIRPVAEGYVYGITRPLHLGNTTQIWEIRISDEKGRLVCISRLTLAVLEKKGPPVSRQLR